VRAVRSWALVVARVVSSFPLSSVPVRSPLLAHANRITQADDYRGVVRKGRRFVSKHAVVYIRPSEGTSVRFGFIVAKTVGIAVRRNLVRRRLKAVCHELLSRTNPGTDVVIRALPGAATQPFGVLCEEITTSLRKGSVLV
jgi:ribonuclease P protein component